MQGRATNATGGVVTTKYHYCCHLTSQSQLTIYYYSWLDHLFLLNMYTVLYPPKNVVHSLSKINRNSLAWSHPLRWDLFVVDGRGLECNRHLLFLCENKGAPERHPRQLKKFNADSILKNDTLARFMYHVNLEYARCNLY